MSSSATALELIEQVDRIASSVNSPQQLMSELVELLHESLPAYDWVGFYMLDESVHPPVLALGPYKGAPTEHTRIPLDKGICGAAASSGRTIVVDDVKSDPRYLACSTETRSEILRRFTGTKESLASWMSTATVAPLSLRMTAASSSAAPRSWGNT